MPAPGRDLRLPSDPQLFPLPLPKGPTQTSKSMDFSDAKFTNLSIISIFAIEVWHWWLPTTLGICRSCWAEHAGGGEFRPA